MYRPFRAIDADPLLAALPKEYVAVRFYFRSSFPDTPQNRAFVARLIRILAQRTAVVVLNPGVSMDEHEDLDPGTGMGIHKIEHLMTPARNLAVQSAVIANALRFVGTYGGLAYLGPFYGVPSIGLYSHVEDLVPAHLEVSRRLSRRLNAPLVTLDVREIELVERLFDSIPTASLA